MCIDSTFMRLLVYLRLGSRKLAAQSESDLEELPGRELDIPPSCDVLPYLDQLEVTIQPRLARQVPISRFHRKDLRYALAFHAISHDPGLAQRVGLACEEAGNRKVCADCT
jgi:hypothetical protein